MTHRYCGVNYTAACCHNYALYHEDIISARLRFTVSFCSRFSSMRRFKCETSLVKVSNSFSSRCAPSDEWNGMTGRKVEGEGWRCSGWTRQNEGGGGQGRRKRGRIHREGESRRGGGVEPCGVFCLMLLQLPSSFNFSMVGNFLSSALLSLRF